MTADVNPDTDHAESDDTPSREALVEHWTVVLAEYYRQADWEQFSGQQKRRTETFEERLLAAQNAGSVNGALKKLARGLGLAAPELPTARLDPLRDHETAAMRVLRDEDIYLVNKAAEAVQNYFDDKQADGEATEPGPTTSELSDFIQED